MQDKNKIIILDKPLNWTSMDVLRKLRNILKIKKIGHAGTLDPLATGVLIVCTGKMTKKINEFMDMPKEYIADINLTAFSQTDDAEGPFEKIDVTTIPTLQDIQTIVKNFIGDIIQTPPLYSAIKINGKRAYKKARAGEIFNMPSRTVIIHNIEIITYKWPILQIKVNCSKGTYIRTLARDIGTMLHTGGYLSALKRTAIGPYTLTQAQTLEEVAAQYKA